MFWWLRLAWKSVYQTPHKSALSRQNPSINLRTQLVVILPSCHAMGHIESDKQVKHFCSDPLELIRFTRGSGLGEQEHCVRLLHFLVQHETKTSFCTTFARLFVLPVVSVPTHSLQSDGFHGSDTYCILPMPLQISTIFRLPQVFRLDKRSTAHVTMCLDREMPQVLAGGREFTAICHWGLELHNRGWTVFPLLRGSISSGLLCLFVAYKLLACFSVIDNVLDTLIVERVF